MSDPAEEDAMPAVAVSIHDVAPATWPACRALLDLVDRVGATPVTLLVVPCFHRRGMADDDLAFVHAIDCRLARGDEVALHGFLHVDDAPPPRTPRAWFERRVMTRAEGEFAAIDAAEAGLRVARGLAMWRRVGWPVGGFVPPAWLLGAGARRAIEASRAPLRYVSVRGGLYHLPGWRFEPTGNVAYSPDTPARRTLSRAMIAAGVAATPRDRLLRIALHPQDVAGRGVMAHWERVLRAVLATRVPVTKLEWLARSGARAGAGHAALAGDAS